MSSSTAFHSPADEPTGLAERDAIRKALEKRFRLVPAPAGYPARPLVEWQRWTLAPRDG
jgi:hypothetical protein